MTSQHDRPDSPDCWILTRLANPPWPEFGWVAWRSGWDLDDPVGAGPTETDAICDLYEAERVRYLNPKPKKELLHDQTDRTA